MQQNFLLHLTHQLTRALSPQLTSPHAFSPPTSCMQMFNAQCSPIYHLSNLTPSFPLPPLRCPLSNSPSPQWQTLQLNRGGLNIPPERHHPNQHTDNIHDIIPISANITDASPLYAHIFCFRGSAGESFGDERAAEFGIEFVGGGRRDACCDCEGVHEF